MAEPDLDPVDSGAPAEAEQEPPPAGRWSRWTGSPRVRIGLVVLGLLFLQIALAIYYWIPDTTLAVALEPTWDAPVLILLVIGWAALGSRRRWANRTVIIGATVLGVLFFVLGIGQGLALREFGYDVVLRLHLAYVPELVKMAYDAEPLGWFLLYVAIVVVGVALFVAGMYFSFRGLHAYARGGRRRQVTLAGAVVAYAVIGGALLGINGPLVGEAYRQVDLAVNLGARLDAQARRMELEGASLWKSNPFVRPGAVRPTILLFVIESYGDALFTDKAFNTFPAWIEERGGEISRAGYHTRTKLMVAPVFGGSSWMADATLLCGVRIENQKRFASLLASSVRCLPELLNEAGYRTAIGAANSTYLDEPFARLFPFKSYYFRDDLGYRGPRMGWSYMPDQFVIDVLHRREVAPWLARPADQRASQPLFVTYLLTSSHHPWKKIPPLVEDWSAIRDGAVYATLPAIERNTRFIAGSAYKPAYRDGIDYSWRTIVSYLERLPADDRSLIIVLGDHQPRRPVANMKRHQWWVPIHVFSRDPATVERFARVGYQPGIIPVRPVDKAAVGGMERFNLELFTAYGGGENDMKGIGRSARAPAP